MNYLMKIDKKYMDSIKKVKYQQKTFFLFSFLIYLIRIEGEFDARKDRRNN